QQPGRTGANNVNLHRTDYRKWNIGVLEYCFLKPTTPLLQYSGLLCLFSLLSIEPFDESTGFDLAKQPRVNEVLRIGSSGLRIGLGDLSYAELHVFDTRMRNSFECRGINPLRLLKHRPVGGTGVFSDNDHGKISIGLEPMHRLDMGLEKTAHRRFPRSQQLFRHNHRRQRISEALRAVIDQDAEPGGAGLEHRRETERAALDLPRFEPGHYLRQTSHLPDHHIAVRHESVLTEKYSRKK